MSGGPTGFDELEVSARFAPHFAGGGTPELRIDEATAPFVTDVEYASAGSEAAP